MHLTSIRMTFHTRHYTQQVSQQVRTRLQQRAKDFFMVIDDVSLVLLCSEQTCVVASDHEGRELLVHEALSY